MIQRAQNQKQTNTKGFAELLQLKIGAKVMLTVNTDMHDHLINGQMGKLLVSTLLKIPFERYMLSFPINKLV